MSESWPPPALPPPLPPRGPGWDQQAVPHRPRDAVVPLLVGLIAAGASVALSTTALAVAPVDECESGLANASPGSLVWWFASGLSLTLAMLFLSNRWLSTRPFARRIAAAALVAATLWWLLIMLVIYGGADCS